jgi:hypothetical protein
MGINDSRKFVYISFVLERRLKMRVISDAGIGMVALVFDDDDDKNRVATHLSGMQKGSTIYAQFQENVSMKDRNDAINKIKDQRIDATVKLSSGTYHKITEIGVGTERHTGKIETIVGNGNSWWVCKETPKQVISLCAAAGWPLPKLFIVCSYADGSMCKIDVDKINHFVYEELPCSRHTRIVLKRPMPGTSSYFHNVRESAEQVNAMIGGLL